MKIIWLIFALLLSLPASSQTVGSWNGDCSKGDIFPLAFGTPTNNPMLGSFPQCTVTVYFTGTSVLATLYQNTSLTPLTNPFNSSTLDGSILFFAATGVGYDIVISGGIPFTMPSPRTYTAVFTGNSGGGGGGSGTVNVGLASQVAYYPATGTAVSGDPNLTDSGTQLGYAGSSGFVLPSDGVHAGATGMVGNTAIPLGLPTTNFAGDIGPNSASFNAWFLQRNATAPTVPSVFGLSAASGSPLVSQQTILPLQGTDPNIPTSGTMTGATGTLTCKDANSGITTTGCTVPITGATSGGGLTVTGTTLGMLPTCTTNQVLAWNGSAWACSSIASIDGVAPFTPRKQYVIFYDYGQGSVGSYGASSDTPTTLGSFTRVVLSTSSPFADGGGVSIASSSTASTNTVIGVRASGGGNFGNWGIGHFYAWANRWAAGGTTNVRYWQGVTVFNSALGGTGGVDVLGTTSLATDTPLRGTVGFRYSSGVDTTWQAVAETTAGGQTLVNTGIAIDTNPHTFAITTTGLAATYYIDGAQVATISTNMPDPTLGNNSAAYIFWTGDNKNTANSVSGTLYWMSITPH